MAVLVVLSTLPAAAAPGDQLWVGRFDGAAHGYDAATAVTTSPDGAAVYVTGSSQGLIYSDWITRAYDAGTGATLWTRLHDGPGHLDDAPTAMSVNPDGSAVYVTGYVTGTSSGPDLATIAYDATTGATLWTEAHDGPSGSYDTARELMASPDGTAVYVTGYVTTANRGTDYATIAYDAATGATLWRSRYNGPDNGSDYANALTASPDGSAVYVTGGSYTSATSDDVVTVAYDAATGAALWSTSYSGRYGGADGGVAIDVAPAGGSVYVAAVTPGSTLAFDYLTLAHDTATGGVTWTRRYEGPGRAADESRAVVVSPDGATIYVTGLSTGAAGDKDIATIAYDAGSGASVWTKRFNGSGNGDDEGRDISIGPDGATVYVTGHSFTPRGYDYATVAYAAPSGTRLWSRTYNPPPGFDDNAKAIVVSPDGQAVYVTGTGGEGDYFTVAYSTG